MITFTQEFSWLRRQPLLHWGSCYINCFWSRGVVGPHCSVLVVPMSILVQDWGQCVGGQALHKSSMTLSSTGALFKQCGLWTQAWDQVPALPPNQDCDRGNLFDFFQPSILVCENRKMIPTFRFMVKITLRTMW